MKKGDRVRFDTTHNETGEELVIIGVIVKNRQGAPYPFMVEVDCEASIGLDDTDKAYYNEHYAGPYNKNELEVTSE